MALVPVSTTFFCRRPARPPWSSMRISVMSGKQGLEADDALPAVGVQAPDELEALVAEVDVAVLEDRLQERLADGEELLVDPAADFFGDVGVGLDGPLAGDHRGHGQGPGQGDGRVAAHAAVGLVAGRQPRRQVRPGRRGVPSRWRRSLAGRSCRWAGEEGPWDGLAIRPTTVLPPEALAEPVARGPATAAARRPRTRFSLCNHAITCTGWSSRSLMGKR